MGQFSVEKPVAPGSALSGNQQSATIIRQKTNVHAHHEAQCIASAHVRSASPPNLMVRIAISQAAFEHLKANETASLRLIEPPAIPEFLLFKTPIRAVEVTACVEEPRNNDLLALRRASVCDGVNWA